MKKIKVLLTALVVTAITATSCSSDDSAGTPASIEAKWTPIKTVTKLGSSNQTVNYTGNEADCDKDYVQFVTGGTLKDVIYFKNASDVCTEDVSTEPATWNKSADLLTINGGGYEGTFDIIKLTNADLIITEESTLGGVDSSVTYYFKKVN